MKPMLISEAPYYTDRINTAEYLFIQPKLNGWRGIINTRTGAVYTRTGAPLTLPDLSREVLTLSGLPEWLDGELYAHGLTLGAIQSGIRRGSGEIGFHVFDVITTGVFSDRLRQVRAIRETAHVHQVQTVRTTPGEITRNYREYLAGGYEGAIIRMDAEYHQGRSEAIFKMKP